MAYSLVVLMAWASVGLASEPECVSPLKLPVTVESLSTYLKTHKIKGLDHFVKCLPREMRANSTFVYRSEGLFPQCSDRSHPRQILFSKDAHTIVSIPGDVLRDAGDSSCNEVEFINFQDGRSQPGAAKYQGPGEGGSQWVVEKPTSCIRCHGTDFHYIWNGYPYWPNIYGEDDDQIPKGSATEKTYQTFLDRKGSSPRYSALLFSKSDLPPYSSSFKYRDTHLRPNLTFSSLLIRLNGLRLLRKLKESPKFDGLKFKILSILSECDTSPRPTSDAVWTKILSNEKSELQTKEAKLAGAIAEHKIYTQDAHPWFEEHIQKQFLISQNTMYDLEKIAGMLGIETSDWFLASDELKFKSYGTIDLDGKLRQELVMNLVKEVDAPDHKLSGQFHTTKFCNSLDQANGNVYRSLGFSCDAPEDKRKFCEDIKALGPSP